MATVFVVPRISRVNILGVDDHQESRNVEGDHVEDVLTFPVYLEEIDSSLPDRWILNEVLSGGESVELARGRKSEDGEFKSFVDGQEGRWVEGSVRESLSRTEERKEGQSSTSARACSLLHPYTILLVPKCRENTH